MKIALTNATLLDGTKDMQPRPNMTIVFDNESGKIVSVSEKPVSAQRTIDLDGHFVMPGLINLHVHLPGSGMPATTSKQNPETVQLLMRFASARFVVEKMCEHYARTELYAGVTTIRTVGGLANMDAAIRERIKGWHTVGPRMLVAGNAVTVPGGHMAGTVSLTGKTPEDCAALVRKVAEGKPDLIKIMITGGVLDATVKGEPGVVRMSAEHVKACCDAAHELGLKVAAHVESPEGVRIALENGVDTIEHGAKLTPELVALFKRVGAADVCTISPAVPLAKVNSPLLNATELTRFNGEVVYQGIVDCAKAALEAGIPVGLGTDTACPFVTHYDMWRELEYFHLLCGVSRSFALHTATLINARIAGIDDITGSVEEGKAADLLVVDADPLQGFDVLRHPHLVVARGKLFSHPKVKKYPVVEQALDEALSQLKISE